MIKTDKPATFSESEIAQFENNPKNKSRGKVQVLDYDSDETPERPARFFVAKPNREMLMMVAEIQGAGNGSMAKANDLLINGCVLAGDVEQLESDDALYFGLLKDITELLETKKKK